MNSEVNYIVRIISQHQIKNILMDASGFCYSNQLTEIKVKYNSQNLAEDGELPCNDSHGQLMSLKSPSKTKLPEILLRAIRNLESSSRYSSDDFGGI